MPPLLKHHLLHCLGCIFWSLLLVGYGLPILLLSGSGDSNSDRLPFFPTSESPTTPHPSHICTTTNSPRHRPTIRSYTYTYPIAQDWNVRLNHSCRDVRRLDWVPITWEGRETRWGTLCPLSMSSLSFSPFDTQTLIHRQKYINLLHFSPELYPSQLQLVGCCQVWAHSLWINGLNLINTSRLYRFQGWRRHLYLWTTLSTAILRSQQ